MPLAYRIANWSRYEKADSKKCTTMQWVAIPIAHDGMGFIEIMSHPEGVRIVGGWLLIVQVAARCPERGTLISDGGRILGAREIALKVRAREDDIKLALDACCKQGWIEQVEVDGKAPETFRMPSGQHPDHKTGQDKTEQDKTGYMAQAKPADPEKASKRFAQPSVDEVAAYCREIRSRVDPQRFIDHYTANGWMVGKNRMKDWRATVRNWSRGDKSKPTHDACPYPVNSPEYQNWSAQQILDGMNGGVQ